MQHKFDEKPQTQFTPEAQSAISQIRESTYSVLVGRNNSGKSFLLKNIAQQWGVKASYIGPARYQNFNLLTPFAPNSNAAQQKFQNFINEFSNQSHNLDNSSANLQQAISELSDVARGYFAEIMDNLLGAQIEILTTIPGNSMSQRYVSCNGHNISYTSSGFRLIATLVTSLLNPEYDTFLIDEPELGISPEAQGILADFIFDREKRAKYFSHIRTLVMATHSTVFLDHKNITNNYIVSKTDLSINVNRVANQYDFNKIHFFLLGNRFETLYLPSCIVLVEGKTDHKFLEKLFAIRYASYKISVIAAHSDSKIKEHLNFAKGMLSDFQRSPYRDRIFVVLDATHTRGLADELARMGLPRDNIIVWPRNGIEYYYPDAVMDTVFGSGGAITISGDNITRNGITLHKNELADRVIALLQAATPMNPELVSLFLAKVEATLGFV
ncbi:ATP-dependent nuclease [Methylobacterium longum]|uniref:AAA family ATPase n=1 Tax=Methylobacterium longum TaxID=767694 RepID=A0ABT8AZA9_9HYPH|nr:AAA family ATPase [Methylobacterium longum]MDN3575149.1 AAA family ATPase [Methylobacterium longum]GJE15154.1 hypothetical protein FOHLNKBM_6232 [Methylobacterium longum]